MKNTNTKIILENDFKCFPPKPLTSSLQKPINIEIKKYSKIIQFKKYLKLINELAEQKLKQTDIDCLENKLVSNSEYALIQNELRSIPGAKLAFIFPRIQIISATVMDWRRGEASC